MSADVTITIESATGVLTVPAAALRGTTATTRADPRREGRPQPQTVQVGLVTNTTAEIKSGLAEGQEVVTGTATPADGHERDRRLRRRRHPRRRRRPFTAGNFPGRGNRNGNGN